jgi:Protein of unknown function (DUF2384)
MGSMGNRTRQDDAARIRELGRVERPTPFAIGQEAKLRGLMLARDRVLQGVQNACNPRYRGQLEQALAYLDQQIADVQKTLTDSEAANVDLESESPLPRPATHATASTERIEAVIAHARSTFGSWAKASDWLHSPCGALNDQVPNQMIAAGEIDEVEDELGRIDHGIYV